MSFCFIHPFSRAPVCAYYGEVWWAKYGAPHIRNSTSYIIASELYNITDASKGEMGPRKNEGSYWGYKEQRNGQLQIIQIFQRTTNNTRALR